MKKPSLNQIAHLHFLDPWVRTLYFFLFSRKIFKRALEKKQRDCWMSVNSKVEPERLRAVNRAHLFKAWLN